MAVAAIPAGFALAMLERSVANPPGLSLPHPWRAVATVVALCCPKRSRCAVAFAGVSQRPRLPAAVMPAASLVPVRSRSAAIAPESLLPIPYCAVATPVALSGRGTAPRCVRAWVWLGTQACAAEVEFGDWLDPHWVGVRVQPLVGGSWNWVSVPAALLAEPGFIDYMVRGGDGNWVFAHRIKNNNVNTEAHMRTGNLPVRYSIDNDGSPSTCYLTADPGSGGTTLNVSDNTYFPTAGTIYIDNELISYTGKTGTTQFTGCTRAATLTQWISGSSRSSTAGIAASHAVGTGIILVSNTCSPTLSHWGSALICDGGFDEDRGYIFNYQRPGMAITASSSTAFLIRLAPSVSNSAVGDLGSRDLLNRSQLLLNAIAVQTYGNAPGASQGSVIVEGVLNPKNYSTATWSALNFETAGGQPSLAQVAQVVTWSTGTYAIPGEQVFAFAATPNSDNRLELVELKELTNSPFGGVGAYPNGPDTLAINVRTTVGSTAATILLRWGEAQA